MDQIMFGLQIYVNPTMPETYIMVNGQRMDFHRSGEIPSADLEEKHTNVHEKEQALLQKIIFFIENLISLSLRFHVKSLPLHPVQQKPRTLMTT